MDRVAYRLHLRLEQAAGVGVSDRRPGDIGPKPRFERLEVNPALGIGRRDVLDPVAGEGRGGGVGTVRAFGDQHDFTSVAPRFNAARMQSIPHSSPCAPAFGLIATPCMPVR